MGPPTPTQTQGRLHRRGPPTPTTTERGRRHRRSSTVVTTQCAQPRHICLVTVMCADLIRSTDTSRRAHTDGCSAVLRILRAHKLYTAAAELAGCAQLAELELPLHLQHQRLRSPRGISSTCLTLSVVWYWFGARRHDRSQLPPIPRLTAAPRHTTQHYTPAVQHAAKSPSAHNNFIWHASVLTPATFPFT